MREHEISIVIVSWNTRELLHECLQSIEAYANQSETIVVDNGSTDDSGYMVRSSFPWIRLIENGENIGYSRANNQGIEASSGRYILLLNSDAQLTEGSLEKMVWEMHYQETVGICGPRLVYPDGSAQESFGKLPTLWSEACKMLGFKSRHLKRTATRGMTRWTKENPEFRHSQNRIEVEFVSGASMLVRRKTLDTIGSFDERFFMFSEEVDLCKRALEAGWKVMYVPGAKIVHIGGGSTGLTATRVLRLYRGKKKYFEKHNGHVQALLLWLVMLISTWIKVFVYTVRRNSDRVILWREVGKHIGELRV